MFDPIHKIYQDLAKGYREGYTLKTDSWQEAEDEGPIEADIYVEISTEIRHKALEKGFNVVEGDIRQLPFDDGTFDTVIDTSTIDHVDDYETAIKEYHRVAKNKLMLVTWVTSGETRIDDQRDLAGGLQYYFNREEFEDKLYRYFKINETWILRETDDRKVICYLGIKKITE